MENFLPKWLVSCLGVLLIALVALLVVQKANELSTTFKNQKPANTISVSGEGKVTATPDLAEVTIGVFSQGTAAADVQSQNSDKVNKVTAFIKAQGIADADITTSQFYLQPQYDYSKGQPVATGYQVNQTVTVKVHGVDKSVNVLNSIIEGAVNNGANEIDGVNLSVENPSDLENNARKLAIDDAKQKAADLAAEAGLSLGKVVNIAESSPVVPGPLPFAVNSAQGMAGAPAASVAPNIQNGSQEIDETMTVTFEVK